MSAEQLERAAPLHFHTCPECKKLIPCEKAGAGCDEYVAWLLETYPCEGQRRKQYEVPAGVCVHCGEEKAVEDMSLLSSGDPSNCCKECEQEIKDAEREELPEREIAWREAVKREEAEGLRRSRTKAQKKHDDLEDKGQMVIEAAKPNLRLVK
jgi:hypothetical protein